MIIARAASATELERKVEFMVPLKMRNFDELLTRVHNGETIAEAEMAEKYYPGEADYVAVINWLTDEGFAIVKKDPDRLAVFASGSVSQIHRSLQADFAEVASDGQTYVSAITAPSVPVTLTQSVIGINGLQPHIRRHKHSRQLSVTASAQALGQPPFFPSDILKAYSGTGLNVDGTGQKIGIVIDTFPNNSDLTSFWSQTGVGQSLTKMEFVQVAGGSLARPSGEETLDVEWSSGIAPGANIRVYASGDLSDVNLDQCYQQILNELPGQPGLHQISLSYGLGEQDGSTAQMQTDAQYFASMAARGVTVFVSSGDGGSSPDMNGGHNGPTQVENPASDPSVTAVGGTSLFLTSADSISNETTWRDSGGGVSTVFSRPSWQTGPGVATGTKRLVPDVAAPADPGTGALVILNGAQRQYGGTSWSAPMWAGFCALINQARSNAGLGPVGLLGPKIYPLIGTNSFHDINSGNNGGYFAGAGHDLCTGVGTPNVATLIQSLSGAGSSISPQPNLVAYQPTAWSDKLVVSKTPGVTTDAGNLQPTDSLYIDWALINNGNAATAATFYVTLSVDGNLKQTWSVDPPLGGNASRSVVDFAIGSLASGKHDLRLKIDSTNAVSESSESDNDVVKTITVGFNDAFSDRQTLSGSSGSVNGTNVGATVESGEPYHAGDAGGSSIWYSWTAPANGPVTFDTFQSTFDTLLGVYTGNSVGALNFVGSNDDANGTLQSRVSFNAVAGVTYQIAIDGYGGATGTTVLHWLLSQPTAAISVTASPSTAGSVSGGGTYASGSSATVLATAAPGYAFTNWTENGAIVSTAASYSFSVTGNRNLTAHFAPVGSGSSTFTITLFASPDRGGSVSGGGSFSAGTTRTVTATPARRYRFVSWAENGIIVSRSSYYSFTVNGNHTLVANFRHR